MDMLDHILSSSLYMRKKDILELKKRLKKDIALLLKCVDAMSMEKKILF